MAELSNYTPASEITTTTVLALSVSISSDGKTFTVTDSSTWSPTGDAVHTTATENYIRVIGPSGVIYDVDASASLAPASATGSLNITMGDLGGTNGDVIPDGAYSFQYLVAVTSPATGYIPPVVVNGVALTQSESYVHTLLAQLKPGCTCKSTDFETAKLGWMYLKAAAYSATCGKYDKVNDYVNQIAKITGNTTGCISC